MTDVDPIRVRDLLGNLADARRRLDQLQNVSEDEFLGDFRNSESAKYLLIVASEAAIDVCNHVVARHGAVAPDSYAECFTRLAELGVITSELAGRLRNMARFRNMLVHLYWEVDDRRVYQILQNNLGDLDEFRRQVLAWITAS